MSPVDFSLFLPIGLSQIINIFLSTFNFGKITFFECPRLTNQLQKISRDRIWPELSVSYSVTCSFFYAVPCIPGARSLGATISRLPAITVQSEVTQMRHTHKAEEKPKPSTSVSFIQSPALNKGSGKQVCRLWQMPTGGVARCFQVQRVAEIVSGAFL